MGDLDHRPAEEGRAPLRAGDAAARDRALGAAGPDPRLKREDLRTRRLLGLWAPLALTFLLVTGATPVVNASINRLPVANPAEDLAAFALLLGVAIFLHSPLFVTREIAIKLSVDEHGARRALRFCVASGFVIGGIELILGLTPAGASLLALFADRPDLVAKAHRALPLLAPMPVFIAARGALQARQIRADDTLWVALGTGLRVVLTAVIGLALAPRLGVGGPVLGAVCMTFGIATETAVAWTRTRRGSPGAVRPLPPPADGPPPLFRFALPLMFANFVGVTASVLYLRIAGFVEPASQAVSIAAFQEVRAVQWMLTSGAMALQALTTAKVETPGDARAMLRFAFLIGGGLTAAFALVAFTPLRRVILVDLLGEDPTGAVLASIVPALAIATSLPLMQAVRFFFRGLLIARGATGAITASTMTTLAFLLAVLALSLVPSRENGAFSAYFWWNLTLAVEIGILAAALLRARRRAARLPPPIRTPRESTGG